MSAIPVIIDIRPTIGALFCGVIATSVFYGVTILQTIFYFQTYPDDKTFIRIVGIVTFFSWTLGLYATIHGFTTRGSIENVTQALRWTDIGANVSAAALDVTITVTLCLQLYFSNHGFETFPKTRRIIMYMSVYLIANNIVTSIITVSDVITFFAAPKTLVYYAFLCMTSKAYTNTFLAQLNARVYIRRESDKSLSNMNPSRAIVFRARQTNEIENSSMDHVSNNRRVPNFNQTYEGPASQGGQGRTMVLEKIEQLV
ncbi:protein [Lentinula edodes]|uniref:Protein n=1 Tax=Lentinula edodes TaxID=5353 RepID=A0A1Q3DZ29_LENED|nr:protein [Lentinula edodes]